MTIFPSPYHEQYDSREERMHFQLSAFDFMILAGLLLDVLRTYSWLGGQGLLLSVPRIPHEMPRIKPVLVACKASTLSTAIAFQPL